MKSNLRELVGEVCGRTMFNERKSAFVGKETSRMSLPLCMKPHKTVLTTGVVGERDTIRGNKWKSEIYIYIYIYIWYVQDTLVARARCYVMWEELSVSNSKT